VKQGDVIDVAFAFLLESDPNYGLPVQCYVCGTAHKAIGVARIEGTFVPLCKACVEAHNADAVARKFRNADTPVAPKFVFHRQIERERPGLALAGIVILDMHKDTEPDNDDGLLYAVGNHLAVLYPTMAEDALIFAWPNDAEPPADFDLSAWAADRLALSVTASLRPGGGLIFDTVEPISLSVVILPATLAHL
jgi:hypothetical protein